MTGISTCTCFGRINIQNVEKAKKYTFLKVFDDLFQQNLGKEYNKIQLKGIKNIMVERECILEETEVPYYERFIPKKEYIKKG